jgi:hypothetical protein
MEDVGKFNGHYVYFTVKWYILWPFGTFCGHLVHFVAIWHILSRFWYFVPREIWQPCSRVHFWPKRIFFRLFSNSAGSQDRLLEKMTRQYLTDSNWFGGTRSLPWALQRFFYQNFYLNIFALNILHAAILVDRQQVPSRWILKHFRDTKNCLCRSDIW